MNNQNSKNIKKQTLLNVVFSLVYEIVVIAYGLIIPRLILQFFGSEINGLASSITQFLNLITIIEGGVNGVIKASLYKPLAEKDSDKISAVYNSGKKFYRRIAIIYLVYGITVSVAYPLIKQDFSWTFTFALSFIICLQLFVQYFFSINLKTLIVADGKGYFVSVVSIALQLLLLAFTIVCVFALPRDNSIFLVIKGIGVVLFLVQPVIYFLYSKKRYRINSKIVSDTNLLKQKWDAFGQNLAFFIHTNTDIVILTIFSTLISVSVYSVYFTIIAAICTLTSSVSTAIIPTIGNIMSSGTTEEKNKAFDRYVFVNNLVTTLFFGCCIFLINPFVQLYTSGIDYSDAYYKPVLGFALCLAEAVYCYRAPYVNMAYICGHFKQTSWFAYSEAIINIGLSILLLHIIGIEGIAIATLVAMCFRMICHVFYLKKNILSRSLLKSFLPLSYNIIVLAIIIFLYYLIKPSPVSYFSWLVTALAFSFSLVVLLLVSSIILERKDLTDTIMYLFNSRKNKLADYLGNNDFIELCNTEDVQIVLKYMLKKFHELCEENKLVYNVFGGTFLGAVRHKDMIPWDDDIDVTMPYNDYKRLIEVIDAYPDFVLLKPGDKNYAYPFMKLCLCGTKLFEADLEDRFNVGGAYIDIFPALGYPLKNEKDFFTKLDKMRLKRGKRVIPITPFENKMMNIFYPLKVLIHFPTKLSAIERMVKKESECQASFVKNNNLLLLYGANWGEKGKLSKSIYYDRKLYKFDNFTVYGIAEYDKHLSTLYGDYLTLPPESKRKPAHNYHLFLNRNIYNIIFKSTCTTKGERNE